MNSQLNERIQAATEEIKALQAEIRRVYAGLASVADDEEYEDEIWNRNILKLRKMLEEYNIPHQARVSNWNTAQIHYPDRKNPVCSIIQGEYSYGGRDGEIEIYGLLTPKEAQYDDVVGHLTAENVFERILNHYAAPDRSKMFISKKPRGME